eukprot:CAMPEP_0206460752 /NCGR_PEP_ID=MMETSP0324_2-20121206/24930_1 /ASSEMBLY_ACC=CAM_ASM_000836 /TAXON_ID=2866 /ORGANISM="Crypthecodinium cohnii, Strain Seligo" /LENGTH=57 /DNA_ID=CAMNT_0053932497 /DNA_START=16 /DNA_END=189 /DNA_ORIENTATION=-
MTTITEETKNNPHPDGWEDGFRIRPLGHVMWAWRMDPKTARECETEFDEVYRLPLHV